ncbi:hypothetical protein BD311DRAFT_761209 [Dichomitus squalens]|uniref:Secreted protein n=1 Tax=Dichomitus squalens TaxID=114155 RepID=A0A4Q9MHS4_9APHY|nr:hypothetical protein BD311DRAFT_761209 [Dichomitus squalens]
MSPLLMILLVCVRDVFGFRFMIEHGRCQVSCIASAYHLVSVRVWGCGVRIGESKESLQPLPSQGMHILLDVVTEVLVRE